MKAKHLIYPSLTMALFFTFSLSVKAQSVSPQNNEYKKKLDTVKNYYAQQLQALSSRDGCMNFTTIKEKHIYTKYQTAIATLAPDNMLAYIPETKNPDNMPIFRHNYGKVGSVDPMPNNYRSDKTGKMITIRTKPDNDSPK